MKPTHMPPDQSELLQPFNDLIVYYVYACEREKEVWLHLLIQ